MSYSYGLMGRSTCPLLWEARHAAQRNPGLLWLELRKDNPNDVVMARRKLATTIVALAAIGETDPAKLKHFALHAARAAGLSMKPAARKSVRKSALAHSI
jgi:hypothetical protein